MYVVFVSILINMFKQKNIIRLYFQNQNVLKIKLLLIRFKFIFNLISILTEH